MQVKSRIYRIVATVNGETRDYAVQCYNEADAVPALAKKLNISEDAVKRSSKNYNHEELQKMYKDPSKIFVRDYETTSIEDLQVRKKRERAQADLYALLRNESAKTIADGNLYIIKEANQQKELRHRPFYCTIGQRENTEPIPITSSNNKERKFYTDTNDPVYDNENTIIMPNTGYIFPVKVNGSTKEEDLNKVFRFSNLTEAYKYVRAQIIDCGIENATSRKNKDLTYLEHCDSWLAGTGIKMGNKEASEKAVTKYVKDMAKVKDENGNLKYPKLETKSTSKTAN